METKQAIRKRIAALRSAMDQEEVRIRSEKIICRLTELPVWREASRVMAYMSIGAEVATRSLIRAAWEQGKEIAVPRCEGKEMVFCPLRDFSGLAAGPFGIPEPVGEEPVRWEDALMLMPGVAFDKDRHRIGYGGGYYDRFLACHPGLLTVALAFDFQVFDEVPGTQTDILPGLIVTESIIL